MDQHFIVATHLSSVNSTSSTCVIVQTARQNVPLPIVQGSDMPAEHAICSSISTTSATGSILLRLIHDGLIIEVTSLSTSVPPLRIVFPAAIVPTPALFLSKESQLHLLALTNIGSLYRLIIPINGLKLWEGQTEDIFPKEYFIRNWPDGQTEECLVHAQGTHCVAVSLPNGVMLRLEADSMGYDVHDDEWVETVFHHGSFLSSFTSLFSASPNASDIITLASHPWPTDIGDIWTLSRDRTLRLWKAKIGCVASKTLPPNVKDPSASAVAGSNHILLDAEQQNLLKIFSIPSEENGFLYMYAVVFIPTPSAGSGGFFSVLDTSHDHFVELGVIQCPERTSHCHLQDFVISNRILYALWDRQGQSVVERTVIEVSKLRPDQPVLPLWNPSQCMQEPELTPAFMEEQLLSPGSLTEKYLAAILKPGVFSSLTLRTALDRYTDACLSIPGPPAPQLTHTYASLHENIASVVGCTVTLNRETQTGGYQHANYWTALKRDWEGFVARCREVERSARWPLAIAAQGQDAVLVVERERVGSLVVEDVPIWLRRGLECNQIAHAEYEFFAILWELRSKIGPRMLSSLENHVIDMMQQEIAFSFAEILLDQAHRVKFRESLDKGEESWFIGRLERISDLDKATRNALDSIGGCDLAIKREYSDTELLNPPPSSKWLSSQTAAFTITSVEARYDLCLSLIILLFFLSDTLHGWDASLLAEVFAVFRGLAMLRLVGNQPAAGKDIQDRADGSTPSPDDVIVQMRNMNVSANRAQFSSKPSLIQHLISQVVISDEIACSAHNFLDATGLLQSISPANVTKYEVLFCNRIRLLGFPDLARGLLPWLPRTPAATFLRSQVWFTLGRIDDASRLLEQLAGCFGKLSLVLSNLTLEDADALTSVLPNLHPPIDSQYSFYLYAADLFKNTFTYHEVLFSQLAIQVAPAGADTSPLWNTVVKGLTDLALYEDAYACAMAIPFEKEKRECFTQLAVRMCEENAVDTFMKFDFAGITSEVEAALAFKARNADPRLRPSYSQVLYTWYTRRGDYRNASLAMYQRARKLRDLITDSRSFIALAEDQLESLSVAINALYLVDDKSAWVLMPVIPDPSRQRQKLSKHVPESKYISSKYDAEIIHLADMEYECTILQAQIDIIKRDPSILSSQEYLLPPALIVMRLAQVNQYNLAMATAQSLRVDMNDLFTLLTNQCIRLSKNPGSLLPEDTSGWLLTDNAASWQGSAADRGWRYLQQSLKRYDSHENDYRYVKASYETILSVGKAYLAPPWLIDILEKYQPEYLIRISLRYENVEDAVNFSYALVLNSDKKLSREAFKDASSSWLPYNLIDQVLTAADAQMNAPSNLQPLRTALNNRIKRIQKLSQGVS
ncbi:nucleoporin Nup120/160-domain-containing protein [Gymnopilus junonius]|uniref:Nucleoporin Nup120/160-domain-containing protein n=1 Tax=Gymnopilus junonius TaxID=109634 RepID=A0A9P5NZ20_GYMJU|nr:nucleoporin Nup120/160-domain-containing protein [Gymnopilus junonius]